MASTINDDLKLAIATSLAAFFAFWLSMEDYQKDRVLTFVIQSAISSFETEKPPEPVEGLIVEEGLEPPTRGL